jgi:hypothetical protein
MIEPENATNEPNEPSISLPAKDSPYWDRSHPEHEAAVLAVQRHFATVYAEPGAPAAAIVPSGDFGELQGGPGSHHESFGGFVAMAQEVGLTPEQAQEVLDWDAGMAPPPEFSFPASGESAASVLRRQWGAEADYRFALVRWVADWRGPEFAEWARSSGAEHSVPFVRLMVRIGARRLAEDVINGEHPSSKAYRTPSHLDHDRAVKQVHRLFEFASERS